MFNYDRTLNKTGNETQETNHENFEFEWENNEMEMHEYNHENSGEYAGESYETMAENYETTGEAYETYGETYGETYETIGETYGEMHETLEMELASELLAVQNEAQLEQFLGKLFKKVAGGVKAFAKSSAGRAIGGILKKAAKTALPIAGRALGTMVGGPLGGMVGGKLADAASNLFELELEGLSNEDREFEMARAYVRFATDAVRRASMNPRFRHMPNQVARKAAFDAARRWAPGFVRRRNRNRFQTQPRPQFQSQFYPQNANASFDQPTDSSDGGTWYRSGNQIVLNL